MDDEAHFDHFQAKYGQPVADAMRAILRIPGAVLLGAGTAAGDAIGAAVDVAKAGIQVGAAAVKE